jgi:hypothetical protein
MTNKDDFEEKSRKMLERESCPYIHGLCLECHFSKMDSGSIASTIFYCLHNYAQCKIYEELFLKWNSERNERIPRIPMVSSGYKTTCSRK